MVITVKDFKSIVHHANLLNTDITARFSNPAKPMQLSYPGDGVMCEFLLMTVGDRSGDGGRKKKGRQNGPRLNRPALDAVSRSASVASSRVPQSSTPAAPAPLPPSSRPVRMAAALAAPEGTPAQTLPGLRMTGTAASRSSAWRLRPSNIVHPPRSNIESDSLFVTQDDDDDRQWAPIPDEDQEEDDILGWNASNQVVSFTTSTPKPPDEIRV